MYDLDTDYTWAHVNVASPLSLLIAVGIPRSSPANITYISHGSDLDTLYAQLVDMVKAEVDPTAGQLGVKWLRGSTDVTKGALVALALTGDGAARWVRFEIYYWETVALGF